MCSRACAVSAQVFPGLILSDIKPAKRMRFRTVCYLLVQLMHCRKMFKAEIPFSNVMTCEDDDKVGPAVRADRAGCSAPRRCLPLILRVPLRGAPRLCGLMPRPSSRLSLCGERPRPSPHVGSCPVPWCLRGPRQLRPPVLCHLRAGPSLRPLTPAASGVVGILPVCPHVLRVPESPNSAPTPLTSCVVR